MKVDKYDYPIIIITTLVVCTVIALALGLTPAH